MAQWPVMVPRSKVMALRPVMEPWLVTEPPFLLVAAKNGGASWARSGW